MGAQYFAPEPPDDDWLELGEPLQTNTNSFIVTIRSRAQPNNPREWRGSAEHVQSLKRTYFIRFSQLEDFILRCAGFPPASPEHTEREQPSEDTRPPNQIGPVKSQQTNQLGQVLLQVFRKFFRHTAA